MYMQGPFHIDHSTFLNASTCVSQAQEATDTFVKVPMQRGDGFLRISSV